jgi:hypothetical protein
MDAAMAKVKEISDEERIPVTFSKSGDVVEVVVAGNPNMFPINLTNVVDNTKKVVDVIRFMSSQISKKIAAETAIIAEINAIS